MGCKKIKYNYEIQYYKGIPLRLVPYNYDNGGRRAMRFKINETIQKVWIPCKHLEDDGTIKPQENIDYVFRSEFHKLNLAGLTGPIVGIKRTCNYDITKKGAQYGYVPH